MIRPFTILCFVAFAGAGAWLYQVKHQVATQDRELREIWRQTEQARDRTAILRAEWALLNEPGRLREVAQRHLTLEAMQPQQFTRLPEMTRRLPGAVAFAGAPNLFVPEHPAPRGDVMLAAAQVPAPAAPAPIAAPPTAPARAAAPPRRAPAPAAENLRQSEEAPAPQALAATMAAQRAAPLRSAPPPVPARAAPLRDTSPPAAQAQAPAPSRPVRPAIHVAPAPAAPPIRTTQAAPTAPTFVSALGNASSLGLGRPMLAPPVPISSAAAATLNSQPGLAPPRAR